MSVPTSSRNGMWNKNEPDAPRTGRHARPVSIGTTPDTSRDRSMERIKTAERALTIAHSRLRGTGADSDATNSAFSTARDCLGEAREIVREAWRELVLMQHEWEQLNRQLPNPGRYPDTAAPVVLDPPGQNRCPDPRAARTPAEFVAILSTYRHWAGAPSFRAMENVIKNQCGQRYAASTLHAALKSDRLPALPLVQAVITACGGSDRHQQMFTVAWRQLSMPQHDDAEQSMAGQPVPHQRSGLAPRTQPNGTKRQSRRGSQDPAAPQPGTA
jgi:hypothetical protein